MTSKLTYFLETMLQKLQGPIFDQDSGIYNVFGFLDRGSVVFFCLIFGNNNIGSVLS